MNIYVTGIGIVSALGRGWKDTADALRRDLSGISTLTLFPHREPFGVGEVRQSFTLPDLPRTHQLARAAAEDALDACGGKIPGAVVMGVTTGGMPTTEVLLKSGVEIPELYRYHATGSVAEYIADVCDCRGPVLTVSTACSSGAVAVALGVQLLRSGLVGSVLAGGADALCRLTYHGFNALQLLSPEGAKPFDQDRKGMSLSEGAAMLFMESAARAPDKALAGILGFGLSCDAYHAASPHPEGRGAMEAMDAAVRNAGLKPSDIDYVNLHGTGTVNNDAAEAKAVKRYFGQTMPRLSSIKGATGHSLAAAGAIELVACIISMSENLIPANHGLEKPDPELAIHPQIRPETVNIRTAMSNSFGFGGNNAALVVGDIRNPAEGKEHRPISMAVVGNACVTGAGRLQDTARSFLRAHRCGGILPLDEVSAGLSSRAVRRLKRLPRLALCLADDAAGSANLETPPDSVFFATGWGALTETEGFLSRLYQNDERFSSPMDFVGSVHNAPAGEIAMMLNATGPNITMTGGDYSFEQTLTAASLLGGGGDQPFLVIGADECHQRLSPLFDASVATTGSLADGGGGLCLVRAETGLLIRPVFFRKADAADTVIHELIACLGGERIVNSKYGAVFAGIPASVRIPGERQLDVFQTASGLRAPVVDYRKFTGEFASASAVGTSLAVHCLQQGLLPPPPGRGEKAVPLDGEAILVLGTGKYITAVEVFQA